jgi:hypothetical protein
MLDTYPNWFEIVAQGYFNKYLFKYKNADVKFLQIGAYTGDATKWLFDNILTNSNSLLVDVDTWQGSDETIHKTFDWNNVEQVYDNKTKIFQESKRLIKNKITSDNFFKTNVTKFDFIYIDGDHTAKGVLSDGFNSLNCLKSGGILAFDDYNWAQNKEQYLNPKLGIDAIRLCYEDMFDVLDIGDQVWLQMK